MSPEDRKSFLLRMDPGLWREMEAWAQEDLRSVNGQIEFLLREAVRRRRGAEAQAGMSPQARKPRRPGSQD